VTVDAVQVEAAELVVADDVVAVVLQLEPHQTLTDTGLKVLYLLSGLASSAAAY
jgi:hypothetical protein